MTNMKQIVGDTIGEKKLPRFKAELSFAANYCFEGTFGNKFRLLFAVACKCFVFKRFLFCVCVGQGLVQSSLG